MNQPDTKAVIGAQDPELFVCIYCERETPNGPPCPICGWPRCAECQRCIDHAAHPQARRPYLSAKWEDT